MVLEPGFEPRHYDLEHEEHCNQGPDKTHQKYISDLNRVNLKNCFIA